MLVKYVYTRHGIPGIAMLGNEVQLSRHECWLLVVNLGFRSVIPVFYLHQSNGQVENSVSVINLLLKEIVKSDSNPR